MIGLQKTTVQHRPQSEKQLKSPSLHAPGPSLFTGTPWATGISGSTSFFILLETGRGQEQVVNQEGANFGILETCSKPAKMRVRLRV